MISRAANTDIDWNFVGIAGKLAPTVEIILEGYQKGMVSHF